MSETIEEKLVNFREFLLDENCGVEDVLDGIKYYLFEGDKEVSRALSDYADDYYKMWSCTEKFYKVKDLIDEEFYSESEDDD